MNLTSKIKTSSWKNSQSSCCYVHDYFPIISLKRDHSSLHSAMCKTKNIYITKIHFQTNYTQSHYCHLHFFFLECLVNTHFNSIHQDKALAQEDQLLTYYQRHTSANLLNAGNPKNLKILLNATVKSIIFHHSSKWNKIIIIIKLFNNYL